MAKKQKYPMKVWVGQSLVTIYRVKISGAVRYQLRWQELGRMERRTFTGEASAAAEASLIASRLAAGDGGAIALSGGEAAIYRRAMGACAGAPLDAVCVEWAEARRRLGATLLLHAVDDYISRRTGKGILMGQAIDLFVASRNGKEWVYVQRLKNRLEHVKTEFGNREISEITDREIRAFVLKKGGMPRTQKNMRDAVVSVFRWAREEGYLPRGMKTEAEMVKIAESGKKKRIGVFTPEEMKKLLANASQKVQPVVAICGFSGVRSQGEISRLLWEDIKWDRAVIDVEGKTGERRFVPMSKNLLAWLEKHRGKTGKVEIVQSDGAFARLAAKAEVPWRHNGLRHSYGSYRVAETKNVPQVAWEMGNSPAMVKRSYQKAVHEDEATAWFSIMPG